MGAQKGYIMRSYEFSHFGSEFNSLRLAVMQELSNCHDAGYRAVTLSSLMSLTGIERTRLMYSLEVMAYYGDLFVGTYTIKGGQFGEARRSILVALSSVSEGLTYEILDEVEVLAC
jgi:hypothetical protein